MEGNFVRKMSGGRVGETIMVFAEDRGRYVGMVSAVIPEGQTKATIQHMYVDREGYRGKGIGKQLLVSLLGELRGRGDLESVELSVVETQIPARELYKQLGFRQVNLIESGAKRGDAVYNEVEMVLDIQPASP